MMPVASLELVHNGQASGQFSADMQRYRFDPGYGRPFIDNNGVKCVILNTGRTKYGPKGEKVMEKKKYPVRRLMDNGIHNPVWNVSAMTKEAWIHLDQIVLKAQRERLSAYADLAASSTVGGFDAFAKLTYEYQAMNDPGEAIVDMDGVTAGRNDGPLFNLSSVPLPIIHSDFYATARQLAVSGNTANPYDVVMVEAASRRIAEKVEDLTTGVADGVVYGTETVGYGAHTGSSAMWGYTNFPYRLTKTDLTTPTGSNPEAVLADVLEMIDTMETNKFYGPYMLYTSTGYSRYLRDDYFRSGSTSAVRSMKERLMALGDIVDIRRLDRLTSGYQLIMVNMDSESAQAIDGMPPTTLMWETIGGQKINWKIMCIRGPLLKKKYNGTSGVLHATAP
jgi:hypothetical protein